MNPCGSRGTLGLTVNLTLAVVGCRSDDSVVEGGRERLGHGGVDRLCLIEVLA